MRPFCCCAPLCCCFTRRCLQAPSSWTHSSVTSITTTGLDILIPVLNTTAVATLVKVQAYTDRMYWAVSSPPLTQFKFLNIDVGLSL